MNLYDGKNWTSLTALLLIPLFAGAADGLMEALNPAGPWRREQR